MCKILNRYGCRLILQKLARKKVKGQSELLCRWATGVYSVTNSDNQSKCYCNYHGGI